MKYLPKINDVITGINNLIDKDKPGNPSSKYKVAFLTLNNLALGAGGTIKTNINKSDTSSVTVTNVNTTPPTKTFFGKTTTVAGEAVGVVKFDIPSKIEFAVVIRI